MGELISTPVESKGPGRHLPALLLLFFGSGCAALIYEIVWFQLLELVIGSSAVSLGVLLATYMGGMCVGSLMLSRIVSPLRNPLRVFAVLEGGIGVLGLFVFTLVPYVGRVYATGASHGIGNMLLRGVVCAICLSPPTLLMGATLPAISRWIETTSPRGVSLLGFLYGGNIAGAVFGCLLTGFYLLRVHDMGTATWVAASINAVVALSALALSAKEAVGIGNEKVGSSIEIKGDRATFVYLTIALSGACALGSEVVWTRLLSLLLGATVYTFSIILAVFLVGLGIGSGLGSILARSLKRPQITFGFCQFLLMFAMAWTAWMIARSLPYWPVNPSLTSNPWMNFQLDLARCSWAILPPAIFWGASFPLALASVAGSGQDSGRMVGRVYAANTAGGILGAVVTSVLLIGWLGTQRTQQILIAMAATGAFLMLMPRGQSARAGTLSKDWK